MEKKIYCGSGKKKSETWLQVTLNPKKFMEYIQEYNGTEFIKLNINVLPEPDKYGKTVSVSVDNWKPENSNNTVKKADKNDSNQDYDSLPF
jgi:hypothetical protein